LFTNAMKTSTPLIPPEHWHEVYALSMASGTVKRNILRQYRAVDTKEYAQWEPRLLELTKRVPMLVLWGDTDPFIDKSFADKFGAQTVIHYPKYGHWIAVEAPEEIAAKLETFLV
jgi:pimeloyl-ACP methyl ester carboxylesterase